MEEELKEQKEQKKPRYYSQEGFVVVELLRGFDEIRKVYNALEQTGSGSFICGGYARWCASPRPDKASMPTDVDIYSSTEGGFEDTERMFAEEGLEVSHENDLAITYKKTKTGLFKYTPQLQLIKPIKEGKVVAVGTMKEILSNFDFTVVRAAILDQWSVMVDADFMHDEENKLLRIKNIHCPVSSTLRCVKYTSKGYWLPLTQVLKLFLDWDARTPEYRDRLIMFVKRLDNKEELSKEEINELDAMMRRY